MSTLFWLSYGALSTLVVFQGLVLLGVVRSIYDARTVHAQTSRDDSDDLVNELAPEFEALDTSGATFRSREVAGQPRAFLFVSPNCQSCAATPDELEALTWKAGGAVHIVCRGAPEDCAQFAREHSPGSRVLIDPSFEISQMFRIRSVPTAVLVNELDFVQSYGNPMRDEVLVELFDDEVGMPERAAEGVR